MIRFGTLAAAALPAVLLAMVIGHVPAAFAHAGNSDPTAIHACKGGFGAVRIVGVTGTCTGSETAIHWGIQGPPGPPGPAGGAGPFLIGGGTGTVTPSTGPPTYIPMFDSRVGGPFFSAAAQRIPISGTISNLTVVVALGSTGPPGPGTTNSFRLVRAANPVNNPSGAGLTELTCTVTVNPDLGLVHVCTDDTHAAAIAAGDFVAISVSPGFMSHESTVRWTAVFTPD